MKRSTNKQAGQGNYYILEELEAPAGYELAGPVLFYYVKEGKEIDTETYPGAISVLPGCTLTVEDPPERSLQVKKVDGVNRDAGLKGAEFELKDGNTADSQVLYRGTSGENGLVLWTKKDAAEGTEAAAELKNLEKGTYYLYETKAPNGYIKPAEPVVIEVAEDGTVTAKIGDKALKVNEVAGTPTVELIIPNESGYVLPESGGEGTTWLYGLGTALILTAAMALVCDARRKKARS